MSYFFIIIIFRLFLHIFFIKKLFILLVILFKCFFKNSEDGLGTLTCPNAIPNDQGAYSCEAINTLGSVFGEPDCILQVKGSNASVCAPPQFNSGAKSPDQCLDCFCFGVTDQCYSSERFVSQVIKNFPIDLIWAISIHLIQFNTLMINSIEKYWYFILYIILLYIFAMLKCNLW